MKNAVRSVLNGTSRIAYALVLSTILAAPVAAQPATTLSPQAVTQIQALLAEKEARSPAEKKIDSQLLYASKMAAGQPIADGVAKLEVDVPVEGGLVDVDVRAEVTTGLLGKIEAMGGTVTRSSAALKTVEARLPLEKLAVLAELPDVRFIAPAPKAQLGRTGRSVRKGVADFESDDLDPVDRSDEAAARRTKVRARLIEALDALAARRSFEATTVPTSATAGIVQALAGSRNSQGDVTHRAAAARGTFGVNGAGLRIGVISDSFNNLGGAAADVAAGDLPGPGNPNGFLTPVQLIGSGDMPSGGSDEGRAMLQIVHDVAPGAQLFYATAFVSITDFANNVRALGGIAAAAPPNGNASPACDIIIDDIFYFVESGLHDGQAGSVVSNRNASVVQQAVNDVTAAGVLYFSSAGNSGNLNDGQSGAWEGDFVSAGTSTVVTGGNVLDWDPSAGTSQVNPVTTAGTGPVTVHWSDPLGASTNDYDLFRLNAAGTAISASSTNVQSGTQDPYEQVTNATGGLLVVLQKTGAADRFVSLSTNRGRLTFATDGQTRGHSGAAAAYGVAATPAATAFGAPPNPVGPYPNPFGSSNTVELFSSDGPRRTFFQPDGTPHTPGNFLAGTGGGLVRQKPDITAADGVETTLALGGGLNPFFGTSAAAPHAGAIAALVKQALPAATPAQVRTILQSTAIDVEAPGVDRDSGHGILDAFAAIQSTGVPGVANPNVSATVVTEVGGNGNGSVEPGEGATILISLRNEGVVDATAVSAVLATATPGVTITQGSSAYPDILVGATQQNATPFSFSLDSGAACPLVVSFTLTVTYTGGPSPKVFNVSLRTGSPVLSVTTTLDATAPTVGFAATATGTQTGRLNRFTPASSCGTAEANPGLAATTGSRRYDAYTFTAVAAGCVTVSLTNPSTTLFAAAYTGSFVPATPNTNRLADAGSSVNGTATFSFDVAAAQTYVIVVHEVNTNGGLGQGYTLAIDGLCGLSAPPFLTTSPAAVAEDPALSDADGGIETCEGGTVSLSVTNSGLTTATGVTATLTSSTPGVVVTSPTASYGTLFPMSTKSAPLPMRFRVLSCVPCGTTLQLQADVTGTGFSPLAIPLTVTTGSFTNELWAEAFDGVTAPALPAGFTTAQTGTTPPALFATTTASPDTAPNAAFTNGVATVASNSLLSPPIAIPAGTGETVLSFRHAFSLESGFDGAVLELSTDGGTTFNDVTSGAVGGTFRSGGYTGTISAAFGNPLAGRAAWTGAQTSYVTASVLLPASLAGQAVVLRWRAGWDDAVANAGANWKIDTVRLLSRACSTTTACLPAITSAPQDVTLGCPGTATFSVTALPAAGPVAYRWRKGGVDLSDGGNVSGSATATLTIDPATSADNGAYDVVVTEATCPETSTVANLSVTDDTVAPVVTTPASITIVASECAAGGPPSPQQATSATSPALATFLGAATAIDGCSAASLLAPQVGGFDVTAATPFPLGTTTVTFRAQDAALNVGTATATVSVQGWADLDGDDVVGATDLTILANHLIGLVTPQGPGSPWTRPAARANVSNPAGSINGVDQVLIQNYLVGNLACLPQ